MRKLWRRFLAVTRLSLKAVCEESVHDFQDYHDYPDDEHGRPWHMVQLKCKRCGKGFFL